MKSTFIAIGSAIFVSLCCTGPILLGILGATTAISFAWIEVLRPYLIVFALLFLSVAFWQTSKRKIAIDCCSIEEQKRKKQIRRSLWVLTPLTLAFLAFPNMLQSSDSTAVSRESNQTLLSYDVEGMTCSGCALGLESTLASTEGMEQCKVSYETGEMRCVVKPNTFEKDKLETFVLDLGYTIVDKKINIDNGES